MARDHEEQADDAALGAAVQLDNAETLDGSIGSGDALDAGYVPPDRPYGLDEDNVTAAGMREGDSLDERLRRETPEDEQVDADRAGRLRIAGEGAGLETANAMEGEDVGIDGGAASAEEAAVHEYDIDAPRETEPSVADALDDPELDARLREDRDDADGSAAARLDAAREAGGAAAAASGHDDVGPGSGLPTPRGSA